MTLPGIKPRKITRNDVVASLLFALGIFLLIGAMLGGCYKLSQVEYGDGFRDVEVQKLARKGFIWKTWEGQGVLRRINLGKQDGIGSMLFEFSVSNATIAEQITNAPHGAVLRLHYKEKGVAWRPSGDTAYDVIRIEVLNDE